MPLERCQKCKGTGEVLCQPCNGTGMNPGYQPPPDKHKPVSEHCKSCHGRGEVRCKPCNGTGLIG